jgi:hypothetical protein
MCRIIPVRLPASFCGSITDSARLENTGFAGFAEVDGLYIDSIDTIQGFRIDLSSYEVKA